MPNPVNPGDQFVQSGYDRNMHIRPEESFREAYDV